ncbi:MAG TPA: 50S ribosomal protein L25 [Solirubrobacteraceae bacterium]|nr:50S ribosomal protein L25 [Solirubrobacteraceae bacterium]
MAETTQLIVEPREIDGSRSARRLRRRGLVPGVVYGGDGEPAHFAVDARALRQALAHSGAVLELSVGDGKAEPVVVKDRQRDPVRGHTVHLDLLRVRLDVEIQTTVTLELTGGEESPGVKEGGVLEQITRELTIEALPTAIPDAIRHDVSGLDINDTVTLDAIAAPAGVKLLDDPETTIATVLVPKMPTEEEIEEETALVGEDGEPIEAPEGEEGEAPAEEGGEGAPREGAPSAAGEGGGGGE